MDILLSAIQTGLILGILGAGVYISFRILNTPDLTIDGTFTLGALIMLLSLNKFNNFSGFIVGILGALLLGSIFGLITSLVHIKLKINIVLSSILTMTMLYTINLRLNSGNANGFVKTPIFFNMYSTNGMLMNILILLVITSIITTGLIFFFKTRLGMAIRATGDNKDMVNASSINPNITSSIGLAIANALGALSGALMVAFLINYDSTLGNGKFVLAVAGIIIGESVFFFKKNYIYGFLASIIGAIIYQIIFALALKVGAQAMDLKLISAFIIILALFIPEAIKYLKKRGVSHARN